MDGLRAVKNRPGAFAVGVNARLKDRGIGGWCTSGRHFYALRATCPMKKWRMSWTDEAGKPSERAAAPPARATTSLWCATSPQLAGMGGVYCEL